MFKNISHYEGGSAMTKDLILNVKVRDSGFHAYNLGHYLVRLASLISLNR
jgi:hypothetical protein